MAGDLVRNDPQPDVRHRRTGDCAECLDWVLPGDQFIARDGQVIHRACLTPDKEHQPREAEAA